MDHEYDNRFILCLNLHFLCDWLFSIRVWYQRNYYIEFATWLARWLYSPLFHIRYDNWYCCSLFASFWCIRSNQYLQVNLRLWWKPNPKKDSAKNLLYRVHCTNSYCCALIRSIRKSGWSFLLHSNSFRASNIDVWKLVQGWDRFL